MASAAADQLAGSGASKAVIASIRLSARLRRRTHGIQYAFASGGNAERGWRTGAAKERLRVSSSRDGRLIGLDPRQCARHCTTAEWMTVKIAFRDDVLPMSQRYERQEIYRTVCEHSLGRPLIEVRAPSSSRLIHQFGGSFICCSRSHMH